MREIEFRAHRKTAAFGNHLAIQRELRFHADEVAGQGGPQREIAHVLGAKKFTF